MWETGKGIVLFCDYIKLNRQILSFLTEKPAGSEVEHACKINLENVSIVIKIVALRKSVHFWHRHIYCQDLSRRSSNKVQQSEKGSNVEKELYKVNFLISKAHTDFTCMSAFA